MNKAFSFLTAAALCLSLSANAQKADRDYSSAHNFIGVQGGGQVTFTHYKLTDLLTPQYAVQFGRYFNDKVGARLHVMGWQNKGGFKASRFNLKNDVDYKFKAITGDLDLLMNMTNIINPNRASHAFDWVLLAGFGVNYGWDFDEYENITKSFTALNATYPQNCGTKHASYNGRFGTQLNWNVSDAFTLGLELQANYKNDMYNLKVNNTPDWQAVALLGLTYNFGYKKKAPKEVEPVYETRLDTTWYNETVYKKVTEEETLRRDIFFNIRKSSPISEQTVAEIVNFVNTHKDAKIVVTGYADKGTGTAKVNMRYSRQRAQAVTAALVKAGIDKSIITTDCKGDTVQPFAENDRNRVTITVATGKAEKDKPETVRKFRTNEVRVRVN